MNPLSPDLRNLLARTVQAARRDAETGARRALEGLAVDRRGPHPGMTPDEQALRLRLRAHGRQLGDRRDPRAGTQRIDRLAHEVACEHWHRMLFARFLAESDLLIEPASGVAVSLAECAELAREQGTDPWALAGGFAERMLPRIFRSDDPALAVTLAPETRQALEQRVESLPAAVFTAGDALGWTYQFWQAERKEAVNRAGAKIGADELPAVTQLFTEPYMVGFLLHNTLGAWRAGRLLAERPDLAETAPDEAALRRAVRLEAAGGYDFAWLRFVREAGESDAAGGGPPGADKPGAEASDGAPGRGAPGGDTPGGSPPADDAPRGEALRGDAAERPAGPWRPAAGAFDGWPRRAAELRVLDPCCGSGHFLVEAFALLVRLRMDEERLVVDDAVRAVLRDNLFGLEIDPRCTQIAAFNLALAAWRLAGRPIDLPPLHVACSGLAPNAPLDEWVALAEEAAAAGGMPADRDLLGVDDSLLSAPLRNSLTELHGLFEQAPELGSLIDPRAAEGRVFQADFEATRETLDAALARERGSDETAERSVAAQGMARAAELLAERYTLVVTNVPYLARGRQSDGLKTFAARRHPDAKADLATLFVSRIFDWLAPHGAQAVVTPQNWLFLTSYRKLRERLLQDRTWNLVARLGPGAFETIGGHVVNVALNVLSADRSASGWRMAGIDVSAPRGRRPIRAAEKSALLTGESAAKVSETIDERAVRQTNGGGLANVTDRRVGPARAAADPSDGELGAACGESVEAAPDTRRERAGPARAAANPGGANSSRPLGTVTIALQRHQLENPDAVITTERVSGRRLGDVAFAAQGLKTGDDDKWRRMVWEVPLLDGRWRFLQSTVDQTTHYGGRMGVIDWETEGDGLARLQGMKVWRSDGVAVGLMSEKPVTLYSGEVFDGNVAPVVPKSDKYLSELLCFFESGSFSASISRINSHLKIDAGTVIRAPFDLEHWEKIAAEKYPNGLPEPYSDDPTSGSSTATRAAASSGTKRRSGRRTARRGPMPPCSRSPWRGWSATAGRRSATPRCASPPRCGPGSNAAARSTSSPTPTASSASPRSPESPPPRTGCAACSRRRTATTGPRRPNAACSRRPATPAPPNPSKRGCATASSPSTAGASTTARSSGTSGTAAATDSARSSTTTASPLPTARAAARSKRWRTATSATGSPARRPTSATARKAPTAASPPPSTSAGSSSASSKASPPATCSSAGSRSPSSLSAGRPTATTASASTSAPSCRPSSPVADAPAPASCAGSRTSPGARTAARSRPASAPARSSRGSGASPAGVQWTSAPTSREERSSTATDGTTCTTRTPRSARHGRRATGSRHPRLRWRSDGWPSSSARW